MTTTANSTSRRKVAAPSGAARDPRAARRTLRRHALGADTARRLLLTLMGEFLLPSGGQAWTSTFIEVLGRFDIEPGTTRQALARAATSGWLASERVGRRTRWRLTASCEQMLVEGAERIFGFAGPIADWDGRWLLVFASVPESDRAARHLLRTRLTWAGLGSPAPGVWIGTHPARLTVVEEVLARAGVLDTAQVFVAEHLGSTDVQSMVAAAWDLAEIDQEYQRFLADFSSAGTSDPTRSVIELVNAWRRMPWLDPTLPHELLPERWHGADAASLFHDRYQRWIEDAIREWYRVSGEGEPSEEIIKALHEPYGRSV